VDRDVAGRPVTPPPPFRRLAPEPPVWLGEYAREVWDLSVEGIVRLGMTKPEDFAALASYCEAVEQFRDATLAIRAEGLTVREYLMDKDGEPVLRSIRANPAVAVQNAAAGRIKVFAREFGFTPSAESNLGKPNVPSNAPGADVHGSPFAAAS
jgi:P27 family predicted phage terminase small subunit